MSENKRGGKNMTLYEITQEILATQDAIDGAVSRLHGEHPEMAKEELLQLLLPDFKKKILSYARVSKNKSAEEAELSAEIKRLQERKKKVTEQITTINNSILECMLAVNKNSVSDALFSVTVKVLQPKLIIDDKKYIPDQFLDPQDPKVNKKELNKWAQTHDVSSFGHFEPNFSLQVK